MNTSSPAYRPGSPDVAVLVGDLRASRQMPAAERDRAQARLRGALDQLETLLRRPLVPGRPSPLASRLTLTGGDEFQGVFREPAAVVLVVREVADRLRPHELRFGLGRGEIATRPSDHPAEMDGPAFHHARRAIEAARKGDDSFLVARGFGEPWDETLTALYRLVGTIRETWTDRKLDYVLAVRRHAAIPRTAATWLGEASPPSWTRSPRTAPGPPEDDPALTSLDLFAVLAALPGRDQPAEAGDAEDIPDDPGPGRSGQRRAFPSWRAFFHGARTRAARELHVSPSTLSKGLASAGFDAVTAAEHAALRLLVHLATPGRDAGAGEAAP